MAFFNDRDMLEAIRQELAEWRAQTQEGFASLKGAQQEQAEALRRDLAALQSVLREGVDHLAEVKYVQYRMARELEATKFQREYEALGEARVFSFVFDEIPIKLFLPTGPADLVQGAILRTQTFYAVGMLDMVRRRMPMAGERALDVGAYIGNHIVFFSQVCGAREVEAFEPVDTSFQALRRNVELNQVKAILHNCGVGAQAGQARAVLNPSNHGGNHLELVSGGTGGVRVVALDDLDVAPFRALKIDVEGWAAQVLEGSRRTIAAHRPNVVVEAFPHEYERVDAILRSLNYRQAERLGDDYVYLPD